MNSLPCFTLRLTPELPGNRVHCLEFAFAVLAYPRANICVLPLNSHLRETGTWQTELLGQI